MKFRSLMTAICVLATAGLAAAAPFAYVANSGAKKVTVIDTADNSVKPTVTLPDGYPYGIAVGASGQYVYVGLQDTNAIAIIDTARNLVVKTLGLGTEQPGGLAVNAAETRLYVASRMSNTLKVINLNNNSLLANVAIADDSSSRPEGVVLNPAGTKAYVADYIAGKVAEIDIDEVNNVYSRASLTTVGASPMGLTISSDGKKLYVASLTGAAAMVDTTTKVVTPLPVSAGASVAITADDSKVYAPSSTLNKLYVIDGAATPNVVLPTQPTITAGTFGSSVIGSKLFLAEQNSLGDGRVEIFNTGTEAVTSIALPTGSQPTSFGNFIGPDFLYNINATNGTDCIITPAGTVRANANGRKFSITTVAGTCEVKVKKAADATWTSVGNPSDYAFTAIAEDNMIDASQAATDTYYSVTVNSLITVDGCLESTPAGLSCASKLAKFKVGTPISIKANNGFKASNWTGDCAATTGDTCSLTVDAAKVLGATVARSAGGTGPVFNVTKAAYYQTVAEATAAAATNDEIRVSTLIASATTTGTAGVQVQLSSQWNQGFTAQGESYVAVPLTIAEVGVIVSTNTLTL